MRILNHSAVDTYRYLCALFVATVAICLTPLYATAHEVYVLSAEQIAKALAGDSPNPFSAYRGNEFEFYTWGLISIIVLSTLLFSATFHLFEHRLNPLLFRLKRLAHPLVQFTAGTTLGIFGLHGVLYGPELPLEQLFGPASGIAQAGIILLSTSFLFGIWTRSAALIAMALYAFVVWSSDLYAFTYLNHLGAYVFIFIMGKSEWTIRALVRIHHISPVHFLRKLRLIAYPMLRMTFGFAVMFAAVYAKFIHSELALHVVHEYNLTQYFPFEPLFIVLGALIIEFLAGLMIFLGIAVRWSVLFLAFWLTLGHLSTPEAWWVHLSLYGIGIAIFCHGYDHWSLEGRLFKRKGQEPVL